MSRLSEVFATRTRPILIAYVTVGYPSLAVTLEAVPLLERLGVDVVELGIPFSDPLVDGVTIQHASSRALEAGVTPATCLDIASQLRQRVSVPLVFMSYYNPILRYGLDDFCSQAADAGVDGLIVPDLPPDEDGELRLAKEAHDMDLIHLVAPTSTDDRIGTVARCSEGFIYMVSTAGVTGVRARLPSGLRNLALKIRSFTDKPVCVGFGVSTASQAVEVARVADGVVVGSRIVEIMATPGDWQSPLSEFVSSLRNGLSS